MTAQSQIEELLGPKKIDLVYVFEDWERRLAPAWKEREVRTFSRIDRIEADNSRHSTLLVVGPEELIGPFRALEIRQRFDIALGLMLGKGPEEVARRYLQPERKRPDGERDILIDRTQRGEAVKDGHRWILPEGTLEREEDTVELVTGECRLLAITSHGRSNATYLPQVVLCGRNDRSGPEPMEHRLAACAHGEQACFFQGRGQVRLEDVSARILFLNSCMSVSGRTGVFSPRFSLDSAAAANAGISHFIGSPTIHHGESCQALLFSQLLNQGIRIGQAIELAEDAVVLRKLDLHSFLIYGDPATRFESNGSEGLALVDPDAGRFSNDEGAALALLPRTPLGRETVVVERSSTPVYLVPSRIGHFLFSDGALPVGDYRWRFVDLDQLRIRVGKELVRPLRRLKTLQMLGVHPKKLSGNISDFENRVIRVRKGFRDLASNRLSASKLDQLFKQIERKKRRMDEAILSDVLERSYRSSFHISEIYRIECFAVDSEDSTEGLGECGHCGEPTRRILWQHRLDPDFSRITTQCYRCGYLSDQPGRARIEAEFRPVRERFSLGEAIEATLELEQEPPQESLVACTLIDIKRFGVEPACERAMMSSRRHRFSITAHKQLPPHHFWLKAYLIANHHIHAWGANVWLSPD